jgi:hypothetical protein
MREYLHPMMPSWLDEALDQLKHYDELCGEDTFVPLYDGMHHTSSDEFERDFESSLHTHIASTVSRIPSFLKQKHNSAPSSLPARKAKFRRGSRGKYKTAHLQGVKTSPDWYSGTSQVDSSPPPAVSATDGVSPENPPSAAAVEDENALDMDSLIVEPVRSAIPGSSLPSDVSPPHKLSQTPTLQAPVPRSGVRITESHPQ